jgi:hypothetical protein
VPGRSPSHPAAVRDLAAHGLNHAVQKFNLAYPGFAPVFHLVPQHSILPSQVLDMSLEAGNPGTDARRG